jgi:hypothetical protein
MSAGWSTDIAAAPRGRLVTSKRTGKDGNVITTKRIEREPVWLASKCGKVILSEWLWPDKIGEYGTAMTRARWSMFGETEKPLAWRPFVDGEFPRVMVDKKATYPNGIWPDFPAMVLGVAA